MRKVTLLIVVLLMASMAVNAISLNANFEWLPENPTDLEDVHFMIPRKGMWLHGCGILEMEKVVQKKIRFIGMKTMAPIQ